MKYDLLEFVLNLDVRISDLSFFEKDAVIDEVHLFNSGLNPFLLSKDILEVQSLLFRPEDRDVLQNQFFLSFFYEISIGLTHFFLLIQILQPSFSKERRGRIEFQATRISRIRLTN